MTFFRLCALLCLVGAANAFKPTAFTTKQSTQNPLTSSRISSTTISDREVVTSDINSGGSIESFKEQPTGKRVPIGAVPDFALENDSIIETPAQKLFVGAHFALLFANILVALSNLSVHSVGDVASLAGVVAASVVLGDFGTGVFHWSVDNYGSINTPVVGTVCAAFQGHHSTPWTITFRSFVNNVYKISYGTIPALALVAASSMDTSMKLFFSLFINWWLISQELHKYSHMKKVPANIKRLQDMGIILSKKEHGLHHNSPFEGHYCILTGICNPILDKSLFFRRLEKMVFLATGKSVIVRFPLSFLTNSEFHR